VSIQKLSTEIDRIVGRGGDNRAELYAYIRGKQTPRVERVFEAGEALRACGVTWASGPLALYAAGYVRAWVETTARVFPTQTAQEIARARSVLNSGGTVFMPKPETAVVLAVFVPLGVLREYNLRYELAGKSEAWRADARGVLTEALTGVPFERLQSAFEGRGEGGMGHWAPIADMASGVEAYFNPNPVEPAVLSAMREWALLNAPTAMRSRIATIQLQLQELRTKRLHALAEGWPEQHNTKTSPPLTGRKKV
jgi:hypothetical protein